MNHLLGALSLPPLCVYLSMSIRELLARKAKNKLKKKLKVQEKQNLEMRDKLAMERTKLANERTFLSYLRTGMAMVFAGFTFIKVFNDDPFYIGVGLIFISIGFGVVIFGYYRFSKKKGEVSDHTRAYTPTSSLHSELTAQADTNPKS